MRPGRQRKRLLKAARRVPPERVWEVLACHPGDPPPYFVVQEHGFEVILGWSRTHGFVQMSICDDVLAAACKAYLRSLGLVFDSVEEAEAHPPTHAWVEDARERYGYGGDRDESDPCGC